MQNQREHWGTRLGFILAAAGSAIGLGTLWLFPYVTGKNGGGLFVLIYALCTLIIGVPVFMAELVLGRRAQRGAVGIFATLADNSSTWKAAGWLGVITSFLIMSYYSVIAGWGLNYVLMSLSQSYRNLSPQEISNVFETLSKSGDITIFWHFAFTALTVAVVYQGIRHGIEYWSKFLTSGLFILLLVLCCYSFTLEGFGQAVSFLFSPDISKFKPSSAIEALGLSLFTLSLGQGIMLTYGSYMKQDDDIPKTAFIITAMILVVSALAGLMIFPIIFTFGFSPEAGPGLVFKTLPLLFSKLPGSLLISTTFFVLFVFTALTSSVALVEVVVANLIDLYEWPRKKAVLLTGLACFIFGIPSALSGTDWLFGNWATIFGKNFFDTVSGLVSVWFLPIGALMISLFSGWVLNSQISKDELLSGTTLRWIWQPWYFFIRFVAPLAILIIMLQESGVINIDALIASA
jgi:neurotransmitter:Na+ symporter, NSS family